MKINLVACKPVKKWATSREYMSSGISTRPDTIHTVQTHKNVTLRKLAHANKNVTLRKLAHAIYRNFFGCKNQNFHRKNVDIFLIFAQNIYCGYTLEPPHRGGSNEYPQSMFWSKNKKNRYTPRISQVYYIKVGFKELYITRTCVPDEKVSNVWPKDLHLHYSCSSYARLFTLIDEKYIRKTCP